MSVLLYAVNCAADCTWQRYRCSVDSHLQLQLLQACPANKIAASAMHVISHTSWQNCSVCGIAAVANLVSCITGVQTSGRRLSSNQSLKLVYARALQ